MVKQLEPKEALKLLESEENSVLVDVRTVEEYNLIGLVNSFSFEDRAILVPWKTLPGMQENPEFSEQLEDNLLKFFGKDAKENIHVIFICRSGGRSNAAAHHATNLGFKNCYNLVGGFEGDLDAKEHRGNINGWKANNLPWRQS